MCFWSWGEHPPYCNCTVWKRKELLPGSTDPRATTQSYPAGAFVKEELSLVMVCSFPRATSHRNITPVFLEVRTKNTRQEKKWVAFCHSVTDGWWNTLCFFFFQPHRNLQTCCSQMQSRYRDQHGLPNGALSSVHSSGWLPPLRCLYRAKADGGSPDCRSHWSARPATCDVCVTSSSFSLVDQTTEDWL